MKSQIDRTLERSMSLAVYRPSFLSHREIYLMREALRNKDCERVHQIMVEASVRNLRIPPEINCGEVSVSNE